MIFILSGMNKGRTGVTRRTISLSHELARQIERVARRERRSFSAAVARLAEEALQRRGRRYVSEGAGESGVPDLGRHTEKYLREIFRRARA